MKINKYHGIFFDTVFYMLVHFYRETLIDRVFYMSEDLERDLRFHDIVTKTLQEKNIVIPDDIKILFYTDMETKSFIISLNVDNIDLRNAGYDDFFESFTDHSSIRTEFYKHYLSSEESDLEILNEKNNYEEIYRIINNANLPDEVKYEFYHFVNTIDDKIRMFIDCFKKLLPVIVDLHRENRNVYNEIEDHLKDKISLDKLMSFSKGNESNPTIISFTLMNPIGIFMFHKSDYNYFRLGECFHLIIRLQINKINFYSMHKILGSKPRENIFDLFLKYRHLSINDISKILRLSYHAVRNHIEMFLFENIVKYSLTKDNNKYFTLNNQYFINYHALTTHILYENILKEHERIDFYEGKADKPKRDEPSRTKKEELVKT